MRLAERLFITAWLNCIDHDESVMKRKLIDCFDAYSLGQQVSELPCLVNFNHLHSGFHFVTVLTACTPLRILRHSQTTWPQSQLTLTSKAHYMIAILYSSLCLGYTAAICTGGIWSMHEMGGSIATGSKDCSMAQSVITAEGDIALVHSFQQQHGGAVKCVRWNRPHVVASCGNDM